MEKVLKKRGRKPKNKKVEVDVIKSDTDTEKDIIISHLPISLNELNNDPKDIFLKSDYIESKMEALSETDIKFKNGIIINKINVYNVEIEQNTKCWWCKNSFNTVSVNLPEQYFEETFYCIGHFCSYNCAKAYNIDLNDSFIWKRENLLNLMYYLTYNEIKIISSAPSWLILKDFGGCMDIQNFRKNFETNTNDYLLLHPPLISRQLQIEESYTKNSSVHINKIDKIFDNYSLKRNKPIETSQINLETTMGLRRKNV